MDVRIIPKKLAGTVAPPSSKSMAHRAILAAALAQGTSVIRKAPPCALSSPSPWPFWGAGGSPAGGG